MPVFFQRQIKLNEKSNDLKTFNTPIGRYRWLRLPFGIKSAPEIFQHIMYSMLEGVEGAPAVMDDILVGGRDVEHHDQILQNVIERAKQNNLRQVRNQTASSLIYRTLDC
jgi:hypothetical protein